MAQRRSTLENDKKKREILWTSQFVYSDFDINYCLFEASDIFKWLIKTYKVIAEFNNYPIKDSSFKIRRSLNW